MDQTHLIFGHRGARYGLPVRAVREIVWLPELAPIEELPPYIAGVFNLRGKIVPVMDLASRFGHAHEPYTTGDRVVVIDSGKTMVGLLANELHDVLAIVPAAIEPLQSYQGAGSRAQFVCGEAKLDQGLAMLLNVDALLGSAPPAEALAADYSECAAQAPSRWFGQMSPEAAEIFRSRASALAQVPQSREGSGQEAYAVLRLDGELFGLGLDLVHEFAHLRGITPLPCCPPHILGNMNLRGNIVTLVDIRPALGMQAAGALSEVMVVRAGEQRLGVPAAEIVDVVLLAPSDIALVPVASDRAGKAYCKGVASVGGHAVGILDLEKILAGRELQVAEQVH
jgi:purine-binding chemotaxis protein CheW